jgi:ribonuclease T1
MAAPSDYKSLFDKGLKMPYLRGFPAKLKLTIAVIFATMFAWLAVAAPTQVQARTVLQASVGEVKLAALPKEAQATLKQIKNNGPYDYKKDGVIFSNRERILPKQKRGYYREFTVKTPGARTRGARRIVAGNVGEYYYSDDHYASFKRIKE